MSAILDFDYISHIDLIFLKIKLSSEDIVILGLRHHFTCVSSRKEIFVPGSVSKVFYTGCSSILRSLCFKVVFPYVPSQSRIVFRSTTRGSPLNSSDRRTPWNTIIIITIIALKYFLSFDSFLQGIVSKRNSSIDFITVI